MRDGKGAGAKAPEQERDTSAPQPRRAPKHRIELSDWSLVSQARASLRLQLQRARAYPRDDHVRALHRLPVHVEQHRLARADGDLPYPAGLDTRLTKA
jgi:hypothetical protein